MAVLQYIYLVVHATIGLECFTARMPLLAARNNKAFVNITLCPGPVLPPSESV